MRVCFLVFFVVFGAFSQSKKNPDPILFTVGEHPVHSSEFHYLFKKNHQSRPEAFTNSGLEEYLGLYINFKLKVAEALARGMDSTRAFQTEFEGYKNEVLKSYQAKRDDTDLLVAEAYARLKEEVRAAHILIALDPEASPSDTMKVWNQMIDIRRRALNGEAFAGLAKEFSADPGVLENGGDLGYFTALEMVYPFENAAYQTAVGSISLPIRSRFGYHLVKVIDRRPAGDQVEVSHILIQGKDDLAFTKIKKAKERLDAGENWKDVCQSLSEDSSTKDNGGKLPPFRKGGFDPMASEFEQAAFGLKNPGEVAGPILTPYGWHLLRLEKVIKLPDFSSYESELRKRIAQDERSYLSAVRQLEFQKKSFGYSENREVISKLFALADSTLFQGRWEFYGDPDLRKSLLFTMAGNPAPVWSFVEFVGQIQEPIPMTALGNTTPSDLMAQMFEGFVAMRAAKAEEQKLERENEGYRMLLKEYREGILLFNIMEQEIWKKASADTIGQRRFYSQRASNYQAGERLYARLLGLTDLAIAEQFLKEYQLGDSISGGDFRKFRTITPFRNYEKGESRIIDRVPWSTGLHKTELDKMIWLVEVKRLVPPGIRSLEEARASVVTDYQEDLEKQWLTALKQKFPVKVDEKVKKKTFARLSATIPTQKKNSSAP